MSGPIIFIPRPRSRKVEMHSRNRREICVEGRKLEKVVIKMCMRQVTAGYTEAFQLYS
jgi:hypothetical protein